MIAKPNTVVGELAICSNCGRGLHWIEKYRIWVHLSNDSHYCTREPYNFEPEISSSEEAE
jgi:hypothetical protein